MKTAAIAPVLHLDKADWNLDQQAGLITFTDRARGVVASAPVQIIGSWNGADRTWLWAWANASVAEPLRADALATRAWMTERGYEPLLARGFGCTESTAWEIAAVACMVCARQFAYRGPSGETRVFFTVAELTVRRG